MQSKLVEYHGVQFGTSGLRGLVDDLTDEACYAYTKAFLQYYLQWEQQPEHCCFYDHAGDYVDNHVALLPNDGTLPRLVDRKVAVSGDLRRSTSRIIRTVYRAIIDLGFTPLDCGRFPTPTLALFALTHGIPGIMVTGSHIPDDRNGIKFFLPNGEITKRDEQLIREQQVEVPVDMFSENSGMYELQFPRWVETDRGDAAQGYYARYVDVFPAGLLAGLRIGLYEHSAVGRELLGDLYESLGAEVLRLGRTLEFVPVDTESLSPEVGEKTVKWTADYELDAILSTDGDSDRPLVFDEKGNWLCGDIIATLTAKLFDAQTVVATVTTSNLLEQTGFFPNVIRTKVGSPYVVAAMQHAIKTAKSKADSIVGFEPNGGFLVGTPLSTRHIADDLQLPEPKNPVLAPLPTRDPTIVHIAVLAYAKREGLPLSKLAEILPPCHKLSDRIPEYPNEISSRLLQQLAAKEGERYPAIETMFGETITITTVDLLDGVRMTFGNGETIHLRASGNAPEFRCYAEATSIVRSRELLEFSLAKILAFRDKETQ